MGRAKKEPGIRFPEFRDRFRELMGDQTIEKFSKTLGISRASVGFYIAGDRIPDALGVANIAKKCSVSADWLLGLVNDPTNEQDLKTISEKTGLSSLAVKEIIDRKDSVFFTETLDYLICEAKFLRRLINYSFSFIYGAICDSEYACIPLKTSFSSYRKIASKIGFSDILEALPYFGKEFAKRLQDNPKLLDNAMLQCLVQNVEIYEYNGEIRLGRDASFGDFYEPTQHELEEIDEWRDFEEIDKENQRLYEEYQRHTEVKQRFMEYYYKAKGISESGDNLMESKDIPTDRKDL